MQEVARDLEREDDMPMTRLCPGIFLTNLSEHGP